MVSLCFAHLAGGINLKNGGRSGLVVLSNNKLNFRTMVLIFVVLIPYISLNSFGNVLKAVNEINGHIGFICFGTGPPAIISCTSLATSVSNK
ncbi:hypothetical protein CM15mP35_07190 [bacterium]|nr:MAG: hypothetical protein CM15mP35_07190 [bacterium]